uniref:Uncharacterized protein n=1 Tax=Nelumbo nucifera TaxID=4432 RepID=A0A822XRN7_NELNU|nr:TPA_asm: hypothetical protein HUJ06_022908 [Nelumbo nucifera]DAD21446.1 TPA_asm: hypothetical protein HUJ06_022909 [Nelumbo nucifera]
MTKSSSNRGRAAADGHDQRLLWKEEELRKSSRQRRAFWVFDHFGFVVVVGSVAGCYCQWGCIFQGNWLSSCLGPAALWQCTMSTKAASMFLSRGRR